MDNIWEFLHPHKKPKTLTCAICGKKVKGGFHYHYKENEGLCLCSQKCFEKNYWKEALEEGVVIDGTCYHVKEENRDNYGFRGFDGRPFKIQLDNGDIYYTTNLWYNGKIPKEYYKGDNARFIK